MSDLHSANGAASSVSDAVVANLKVPPHSIEAEQSVLGALMLEENAWDRVAEIVKANDFYRRDHRLIFKAIAALASDSEPRDVLMVSELLKRRGELDDAGGSIYLGEIIKNTASAANVSAYAEIVRERSVLRQLINASYEITDSAFQPQGATSEEILDDAERKIFAIAEQQTKGDGPQSLDGVLSKTVERISQLFESDDAITGLSTGFDHLDEMTSGLQKGDLVIVAARPSMGKTTFAMNLVENAVMNNVPALVFSMEMPSESIAMRMISSLGRINQTNVRSGKMDADDMAKFTSTISMLHEKKLFIDDSPALSPTEVRSRARRVARDNGGKLGLIMVDYLQLMRVPGMENNRVNEISEISRSLKALAKEMNCPVIALSQLNRGLEQRPNKRPVMSDLRESGAIEQDADIIMFIYRDEVYNKDSDEKGIAEIIIGKQRNGPIGFKKLSFLGHYTRFENLAPDYYRDQGPEY